MRLTRFTFSKLRWLLHNPAFKATPFAVVRRILWWEWIRLADKPVKSIFDGTYQVMLRPNEGASRLTYYFGNSEPETFAFMDAYLETGMCVVDVGANIGLNALYAARRVGESGKVIAIEPDPGNFARIRENIPEGVLPQIELLEAACGAQSGGKVVVHSNSEDSSRSFVSTADAGATNGGVAVVAIDDLVQERDILVIDYLKIDVEGFEEQVLRGALRTISSRKVRVLHVELDPDLLGREGSSVKNIVAEIEQAGLRSCRWDETASCFRPAGEGVAGYYGYFVLPSLLASPTH